MTNKILISFYVVMITYNLHWNTFFEGRMKQLLWIAVIWVMGVSGSCAAQANYGLATIGYSDADFANDSEGEISFSLAYGRQIHEQWYAEGGYYRLFDYSNDVADASGDALYAALLGKASNASGELFYKLGVAKVDISSDVQCGSAETPLTCAYDDSIAAGLAGLGFDYYLTHSSMVRMEYVFFGGEDNFSAHTFSIGFRYNFK